VAKIKTPVLAHYGELDTRITSGWPAFDAGLTAAHVTHAGYVYSGANHGLPQRYDAALRRGCGQACLAADVGLAKQISANDRITPRICSDTKTVNRRNRFLRRRTISSI
jgi:dienelactone hydrolase